MSARAVEDPHERPDPLEPGDLDAVWKAAAEGATYKQALETLLVSLPPERTDRLMQVLREARGAWFPLLRSSGGELLFVGNSLSGAIVPLGGYGFRVTVLDPSAERVRFARWRAAAHAPGYVKVVVDPGGERLPFDDASFDVVVLEDGLSGRGRLERSAAECLRVSRGEVVIGADNRLAYKRSTGRRSQFRVPGPLEYVRTALAPPRGERTLHGCRRLLSPAGSGRTRAFALYPHAQDFTHVVALDAPRPALTVGPRERKNRLKIVGQRIGLFPLLTPSFALIATRRGLERERMRIERILFGIAQATGEPLPEVEHLVATRGNTAVIHTAIPGVGEEEPRGRWTLHLPLSRRTVPQFEVHVQTLERMRNEFPQIPVPGLITHGTFDGAWLACERRLPGWTSQHVSDGGRTTARMLADAARHFAQLVVRAPAPFTEAEYEKELGARFDLVAAHAVVPSTIAALGRMREEFRERFVGRVLPRVLYHADLRGKHVQVARDGTVIGYLDWGTAEAEGLPYVDLLHLVIHERKQAQHCTAGEAWKPVRDRRGLHAWEESALAEYRAALGLDDDVARAIEELYPVLVAAMAEKNWDFSRPRWVHEQFGI